nr:PREDICTED: kin of IRRE-like protein 1 [Linepithema humile]XP_012234308.1 PREDICTED: kin of IRRE-like protein 1 [Linepithema humile]
MTIDFLIRFSIFLIAYTTRIVVGIQHFVEMPPDYQEVSAGDSVQLPCMVHNKRGECVWQKDNRLVGMQQGKYEWASKRDNDCTLQIRNVALSYDDGLWECQVSPSDFTIQDGLLSNPSRLLVMVKPKEPRLEYGLQGHEVGPSLTIEEGKNMTVSCVSKYGNPPAFIKWFIGKTELKPQTEQNNATEVDNKKTWAAHSRLQVFGRKEYHGLPLRCVSEHPTSAIPAITETRIDIYYKPEVQLEMNPRTAVPEHSASFLSLKCLADSNPVPNITWYKDSVQLNDSMKQSRTAMHLNGNILSQELRFEPIQKHNAGLYSCRAQNSIGESALASYRLDVQYEPKVKNENNITMDVKETVHLNSAAEPFECPEYDANPPAQYKWVHLRGNSRENREYKSGGRRLRLESIIWSDEGEYRCIAYNMINGAKRETISDVHYVLYVTGPPEIQARSLFGDRNESIGWAGESAYRLKSRVCSQPPPKLVAWQWGSSHIQAGESIPPKYEALPLEPIIEDKMVNKNCYWAQLKIKNLQKEDARMYTFVVESEKGRDSTIIRLTVRDPTEFRVIFAAILVGLLFLLVAISACVYGLLRIRRQRYRQKMEEEGSIAADALYGNGVSMDRQKSINSSHAKKSNLDNCSQNVYDYNHIAKQTRAMSPEALKVRRAPAVLQPPTIV